jgi:homoaconitase
MQRSEDIVKQAAAAGLKPKADFFVTPGSEQIRATLDRDNTISTFESAGGIILANACGPCIGNSHRQRFKTKLTRYRSVDKDGRSQEG